MEGVGTGKYGRDAVGCREMLDIDAKEGRGGAFASYY
jgi:hypothetical protein